MLSPTAGMLAAARRLPTVCEPVCVLVRASPCRLHAVHRLRVTPVAAALHRPPVSVATMCTDASRARPGDDAAAASSSASASEPPPDGSGGAAGGGAAASGADTGDHDDGFADGTDGTATAGDGDGDDSAADDVPAGPSRAARFWDTTKSVIAGVFGVKRPTAQVANPAAVAAADLNTTSGDIVLVGDGDKGRWEQMADWLQRAPLIQSVMDLREAAAQSEVAASVRQAKAKVQDVKGDLEEKWETSQHPLVYNMSAAYDGVFAESEHAQALRALRAIDPAFDTVSFLEEMREVIIPQVIHAFLVGSRKELAVWCAESAMAQVGAVLRAREAEQLTMDPTVLSIGNLDLAAAKVVNKRDPVLVVSSMVQQINCMTNAKGEVVEGNEDEIRAVFYVFAMARVYEPETASLHWRVAEMSMVGSQLYL